MFDVSNFTNSFVTQKLKDKFDISGTLEQLPSDRDQVFHVRGDANSYVMKIYNSAEEKSVIELQDAAAKYIMKNIKAK